MSTEDELCFDKKLLEPLEYLTKMPGKKIRTKLIQSFNFWLKIDEDKLEKITDIIELLHNSSLLIDDIEDHSVLRRGMPVAHKIYGVPLTINCANYAYFIALKKITDLGNDQALRIFCDQLLELHRGQGMEIWYRDNFICPTEEQYLDIIKKKTGGLFKLAIMLMKIYSDDERDFNNLIDSIGLFFQIRDDLANLRSKEYSDSKSYCEDLTEGKFSYPVIHWIKKNPDNSELLEILKLRTDDVEVKKRAIKLLEESGSFDFTINMLKDLKKKIFDELKKYHGNHYLEKMLSELCKLIDTN